VDGVNLKKNKTIGSSLKKMFAIKKPNAKKNQAHEESRPKSPSISVNVSRFVL